MGSPVLLRIKNGTPIAAYIILIIFLSPSIIALYLWGGVRIEAETLIKGNWLGCVKRKRDLHRLVNLRKENGKIAAFQGLMSFLRWLSPSPK
ncbi:MAG: hypothetical protein AAF206_21100 [Bacteroidota bacterium]